MIRSLFLILFIIFNLSFADENDNLVLQLEKDETLATAINNYIQDRAILPVNITVLKSAGYLPATFDENNTINGDSITFSYLDGDKKIRVNTSIETTDLLNPTADAYINNDAYRKYIRTSLIQGVELVSDYVISIMALQNLKIKALKSCIDHVGRAEPTTYTSVNNNDIWFEGNFKRYNVYKYNGTKWEKVGDQNTNYNIDCSISNNDFIELSKTYWNLEEVTVTEEIDPIICDTGTNYNSIDNRCEAYTSNACGSDQYDLGTDKCWYYEYANKVNKTENIYVNSGYWENEYETTDIVGVRNAGVPWNVRLVHEQTNNPFAEGLMKIHDGYSFVQLQSQEVNKILSSRADCGVWNTKILTTNNTKCFFWYAHHSSPTTLECKANDKAYIQCPTGQKIWKDTSYWTTTTVKACPSGYSEYGSSTQCRKQTFYTPSCSGKSMSVTPFYSTHHYGNNGLCYSDVGLYCKGTGGISWDGTWTCWKSNQRCNSTFSLKYEYSGTNDKCSKYNYTCSLADYNRYGLEEHSDISNATTLFNSITNPHDKATGVTPNIINDDYDLNDNNGAMCVKQEISIFNQTTNMFNIDGENKSVF